MKNVRPIIIGMASAILLGACVNTHQNSYNSYSAVKDKVVDEKTFLNMQETNEALSQSVLKKVANQYYKVPKAEMKKEAAEVVADYRDRGVSMSNADKSKLKNNVQTNYAVRSLLNDVLDISNEDLQDEMKKDYYMYTINSLVLPRTDENKKKLVALQQKLDKTFTVKAKMKLINAFKKNEKGQFIERSNSNYYTYKQLKDIDFSGHSKGDYQFSFKVDYQVNYILKSEKAQSKKLKKYLIATGYSQYQQRYQSLAKLLEAFDEETDDFYLSAKAKKALELDDVKANLLEQPGTLFLTKREIEESNK